MMQILCAHVQRCFRTTLKQTVLSVGCSSAGDGCGDLDLINCNCQFVSTCTYITVARVGKLVARNIRNDKATGAVTNVELWSVGALILTVADENEVLVVVK